MTGRAAGLWETFETIHAVMRGAESPEAASRALGLDASRVAFYADAVFEHVEDILAKNFSVLADVLGAETFGTLVREFFSLYPAKTFELNENAAPFRDYLAGQAASGRFGLREAHLELAELEWQEFVAYVCPERIPERRWLTAPVLNPTLTILQLETPVAGFLDAWRDRGEGDASPALPLESRPETVFVLRHPETENSLFVVATDALLFAFKAVHDEMTPKAAARAAGVPEQTVLAVLKEASDWGIVLLPEAGEPPSETQSTPGQKPLEHGEES